MKHTKGCKDFVERIAANPVVSRISAFFDWIVHVPLHLRMAVFAIIWGSVAIYRQPFSFKNAELILEGLADENYWGYSILLIGILHIIAYRFRILWMYVFILTLECLFWWLIFTAFIFGGVLSAGLTAYGFIAVAATINLVGFDEGMNDD